MSRDADLLRTMRSRLRAELPPRAFLKRDRGEMLFVSNAPAIDPSFSSAAGFTLKRRGTLAYFLPDESWPVRLEARHRTPPDAFCASLLRFRGAEIAPDTLLLFAFGVKLLETADAPDAFDRRLRRAAAVALRGGMSGGGLYALALIDHMLYAKGDLS